MITTITDDIMKTDFDLYNRVTEGFETEILDRLGFAGVDIQVEHYDNIIFCHDMSFLKESMLVTNRVVCLGEKWNGKGCLKEYTPDFKKLYVSDNIDELRWIIRELLAK